MLHVDIAVTLQIAACYDTLPLISPLARNLGGKRYSCSTATDDGIRTTSPSILVVKLLALILQPISPENRLSQPSLPIKSEHLQYGFCRGLARDLQPKCTSAGGSRNGMLPI